MTKMQISDYFEKLNLSEIEAKLYVTLLESGPITVRELAEAVEMKRTTAYLYIDQLINKGLIMKVVKGARKLVAVVDPESSIERLITDKLNSAKALELQFPAIIKQIEDNLPKDKDIAEAEIKYYKGRQGVKKIYEEAFGSKELRSYANLSEMEGVFPENLFSFSKAMGENPNLKLFEIVENSPASRKQTAFSSQNPNYKFKFIPKDVRLSSTDTLIYDGKVAIVNIRNTITGVVLQNKDHYNNSRELFDFIWRMLPDYEIHS